MGAVGDFIGDAAPFLDPIGITPLNRLGGGGGGGDGGGTQVIAPGPSVQELRLIEELIRQGQAAGAREAGIFDQVNIDARGVRRNIPQLENELADIGGSLRATGGQLTQEGLDRRNQEEFLLRQQTGIAPQIGLLGGDARRVGQNARTQLGGIAGAFENQGGLGQQSAIAADLTGGRRSAQQELLGRRAGQSLDTTSNIGDLRQLSGQSGRLGAAEGITTAGDVREQGRNIARQGLGVEQDLAGTRRDTLGQLNAALQGEVSPAVQALFTDAGGALERDVLEAQFLNAENALRENAPSAGGGLNRNLALLQTNRALGIAGQEARRTDQQRALARDLFGSAINQGLTAPQQIAALRGQAGSTFGQAGNLQLGAESTRQGAVGLGGSLQGQIGQQLLGSESARQGGIGLGAGIFGNVEGQRQAALGQAANIFGNVESQRQSSLAGALGALDSAFGRDLQGIQNQQAALAQQQALGQSLGAQFGAGGDQLRLSAPNVLGQAAGIFQGAAAAPGLPANVLQGISVSPASSFLGPALGSATQSSTAAANVALQQNIANQQARTAQNAGLFNLLGTGAGIGALALFT